MQSWPNQIALLTTNETDIELFECVLADDHEIVFTSTLDETKGLAQKQQAAIIIIDTESIADTGPSAVTQIKDAAQSNEAPYIILFGDCNTDCKLHGFEAGVDEFLPKPFNLIEFHSRLNSLRTLHEREAIAKKQAELAKKTAFDAMEASSELGIVMRYTDSINGISHYEELGDALLSASNSMGLKCSYQFRLKDQAITNGNPLGSFDERILTELNKRGNTLEFGKRTIFNLDQVSLLVKNMPESSSMQHGRLKDNLQILCNATENKVRILDAELALKEQKSTQVKTTIQQSHSQLNQISNEFDKLENGIDQTMQWLKIELEEKLLFLGLSEEQERALRDMVDDTIERLGLSYNTGIEINNLLGRTKDILSKIL